MGQFDPYSRVHFKNSVSELEGAGHQSKVLWYNGWNNGEPIDDYCSVMNNTKIALVPTGSASYESFRFFEAAQAGCPRRYFGSQEASFRLSPTARTACF